MIKTTTQEWQQMASKGSDINIDYRNINEIPTIHYNLPPYPSSLYIAYATVFWQTLLHYHNYYHNILQRSSLPCQVQRNHLCNQHHWQCPCWHHFIAISIHIYIHSFLPSTLSMGEEDLRTNQFSRLVQIIILFISKRYLDKALATLGSKR